jgi:hypothetical protein
VLTNPYRLRELSTWVQNNRHLPLAEVSNRLSGELALRYMTASSIKKASIDLNVADLLRSSSLAIGDDVSPVGVTRWAQPWVPLWCDWELEPALDNSIERWKLGTVDIEVRDGKVADAAAGPVVQGRSLLTSAAAKALAAQIRQWLADEDLRNQANQGVVTAADEEELATAAASAEGLDVLAGSFHELSESILGIDPLSAMATIIDEAGNPDSKPLVHDLPLLLAGGAARITRMRVVDAFGRWRDLTAASLAKAKMATTIAHPQGAPHLTLAPRIQRPARLAFRLIDPRTPDGGPEVEARINQEHEDEAISPVAGWLMPDHVDEALEFFDASGNPLGQLMHDELSGGVTWEGSPGRPGPIGVGPDPGDDTGARHLTALAAGMVAADAAFRNAAEKKSALDSALTALLRAVDTTLWTVDPLGSVGTGAVAGLVGRPIAVVRAVIRLEIQDDLDLLDYDTPGCPKREERAQAYVELAARAIEVRLGTLTRTDDGLLAYAVDDDYSQLRLVAPEVREQSRESGRRRGHLSVYPQGSKAPPEISVIQHPYVSGPTEVFVRTGQTVRLTLLMNPGGKVHVTSGILPRKSLALARDWFHSGLTRLSPSFRVGPVLVDPTSMHLPTVTGLGKKQVFTYRDTPLTWRDDPIVAATQTAYLPEQPSTFKEGWIRVEQRPPANGADQ